MATDTDDQGFDDALKNFQLLTGLSPAPAATVPAGNPFQIGPTALEAFRDSEAVVKQIFGTHCECGAERMLPTTSPCSSTSATAAATGTGKHTLPLSKHGTSLEHGIINPTPFKHKIKGEKKTIVRESMLKNIGKCVHQNLIKQNSIAKEAAAKQHNSAHTFLPAAVSASQLKPSLSETNLTKCFNNDESEDILDFRLLVAQCSELTLSSSTGTGKSTDGPNYSQSSFKSLRQPDFAGFRLNRSTGSSNNSRRNRRTRQLKRYNSTSSLESDSSSNSSVPFGVGSLAAGSSCTTGGPSTSQNPLQQQSPSASSPSSSASASCSTQARLNNVMPCDITIDEMASYFETLVHIPKKMSSMAEMMYI